MKERLTYALAIGVLAMTSGPSWAAVSASKELADGAQFTVDGGTLRIQFWSPDIVRVTYAGGGRLPALKSLYEGDNYNYEKGNFATIPISWNDATRTLEFGKRSGEFPGMLRQRTFSIVWVSENHGAGVPPTERPDTVVRYQGDALTVNGPK